MIERLKESDASAGEMSEQFKGMLAACASPLEVTKSVLPYVVGLGTESRIAYDQTWCALVRCSSSLGVDQLLISSTTRAGLDALSRTSKERIHLFTFYGELGFMAFF